MQYLLDALYSLQLLAVLNVDSFEATESHERLLLQKDVNSMAVLYRFYHEKCSHDLLQMALTSFLLCAILRAGLRSYCFRILIG